jgi:Carbohydrate family 9 binding domain-like
VKNGYSIIARFPLARLQGFVARPGYKIGFDVAINDNDGTNYRKNQHIWAGYNQNQSWWDMGTIGALIFGPRK